MTEAEFKKGLKCLKDLEKFEKQLRVAIDNLLLEMRDICQEEELIGNRPKYKPEPFELLNKNSERIDHLSDAIQHAKTFASVSISWVDDNYFGRLVAEYATDNGLPARWFWSKTWKKEFRDYVLGEKVFIEEQKAKQLERERKDYERLKKKFESISRKTEKVAVKRQKKT